MEGPRPSAQRSSSARASDSQQRAASALTAGRDVIVERAKGVLMGRYLIGENEALGLLRKHARNTNLRLVDVAVAVLESHALLGGRRQ